jgi:hypothetical protein
MDGIVLHPGIPSLIAVGFLPGGWVSEQARAASMVPVGGHIPQAGR